MQSSSQVPAPARSLLDRFTADVTGALPLVALWAHGSLALGDYQPGRSDLDLIAVTSSGITGGQRLRLQRLHEKLAADIPLAEHLHCSYVARAQLADVRRQHVTWAMSEMFDRRVSPVSRRELAVGGLCLYGAEPAALVPPVGDDELEDFIRGDLRDFWHPRTERAHLWLRDVWVDLGLLTLARATVTLREGRLITKREAFKVLAGLGAPADVVRDIYQRRYAAAAPITGEWQERRGELARGFVRNGIERLLAEDEDGDGNEARPG
jgi:hypothetical protein